MADPNTLEDEQDVSRPSTAALVVANARGWGTSALARAKDRAAAAKSQIAPNLQNMKEKTSKRLGKYQPSLDRVKNSASAVTSTASAAATAAANVGLSKAKEGSNKGWSMLKNRLAYAAPVAEKFQGININSVTDMVLNATGVNGNDSSGIGIAFIVFLDDPCMASTKFVEEYYKSSQNVSSNYSFSMRRRKNSTTSRMILDQQRKAGSSSIDQVLANPFAFYTILLFCGDIQTLSQMAQVNKCCHAMIQAEKRIWRFCIRYGAKCLEESPKKRFELWEKMIQVKEIEAKSELDYDTYRQMAISKGECTELIHTDVKRTYGRVAPHKRRDKDKEEKMTEQELIEQLSSLLHALAGRFPDVGYCQGMDYIAAFVLDHVKKSNDSMNKKTRRSSRVAATNEEVERAFWVLVGLFENYGLRQMFAPGLERLHVHCYQFQKLFELTLPDLYEHFEKEKIMVEMFTVGWFQTLFLYLNVLPKETLNRIWDVFLFENNWKIIMRISLAILMLSQEHLITKSIDQVMQYLNTIEEEILISQVLLPHAFGIKITNRILKQLSIQSTKRTNSITSSSTSTRRKSSVVSTSTTTSSTTTTSSIN